MYQALQCSVNKNLIFWLETKVGRLVDLPFNAIKVHLVAVFVFFVTAASFIEIIFSYFLCLLLCCFTYPCEMAFGIPIFLGIPRNKGVNFHGKFGLGIPRNS